MTSCSVGSANSAPEPKLKLPAIVSDNMVLQAGVSFPLQGQSKAKGEVSVSFSGTTWTAHADARGKWKVDLPPLVAGGPYEMTVTSDEESVLVRNILVGDVWFGSGQSNMAMTVRNAAQPEKEMAAAHHPQIRIFKVERAQNARHSETDVVGKWEECSPESIADFSATAYYFGRELQTRLGRPIGLIDCAVGGTPAESWISPEGLRQNDELTSVMNGVEQANADFSAVNERYVTEVRSRLTQAGVVWPAGKSDDVPGEAAGWASVKVPDYWDNVFFETDGIGWYRKHITVPTTWQGKDLRLSLGILADCDRAFFNGVEIGQTGFTTSEHWNARRDYRIPPNLLKAENTLEIEVLNYYGKGGFQGPEENIFLEQAAGDSVRIPLGGEWQFHLAETFDPKRLGVFPPRPINPSDVNFPTGLYNAMVAPLTSYPVKGVIWYQGESNTQSAEAYEVLFPALIRSWRRAWGQADLPFLYVQLAGFFRHMPGEELDRSRLPQEPVDDDWAELREVQLSTLSVPQTGMAVTLDIGEATDIHPKNKQEVGRRLAVIALNKVYAKPIAYSGPVYTGMVREDSQIRLKFDHVGSGLVARDGALKWFAIAGEDRRFVWAEARIEQDTVVVSSPEIKEPIAVRYAWFRYPEGANLSNQEGFPATPFRTDRWKAESH